MPTKKKDFGALLESLIFDPEGAGYDYLTALSKGMERDASGHFPSREPKTGQLLKGRRHPTIDLALNEDAKLGFVSFKGKDGKYYSQQFAIPSKNPRASGMPLFDMILDIVR